jgi:hypothetical protein
MGGLIILSKLTPIIAKYLVVGFIIVNGVKTVTKVGARK